MATYSKLELVLSLYDAFKNPVSVEKAGSVSFVATINQVGKNGSSTRQNLITTLLLGSSNQLLLSFIATEVGEYILRIGDGTYFVDGFGFSFSVFSDGNFFPIHYLLFTQICKDLKSHEIYYRISQKVSMHNKTN